MIEGLVGLTLMMLLCCLRVPISFAMAIVGIAGYGDTTDVLRIPVGPFVYFMAAMIFLTALVHVFKVFVPGTRRSNQATT